MPEKTHATLRELQELDRKIAEAEDKIRSFDPQLAEVDAPALQLEQDVTTTRARLREMKVDERRIELAADEKRQRIKKLQERMNQVRNVREEAAVSTEIQMLKRALDGEEQEALTLIDQIRRMDLRLAEQESQLEEARTALGPRQSELLGAKADAERELSSLREQRLATTIGMAPKQLRTYEGIRGAGRRQAVSELTADGACGNCFSMIPLQLQNEVRVTGSMVRCEACGVILTLSKQDAGA
jgi:predicted  nucleic acid-binding Zn-ribbon protein